MQLFFNGNIVTLNHEMPEVNALLVEDGIIKAIGDIHDFNLSSRNLEKIDLEGRTVLPGFNDSHLHLVGIGEAMEIVDLSNAHSLMDMQKELKDFIRKMDPKRGEWIRGRGWNQNFFKEKEMPDKSLLDKVSPHLPVIIKRSCHHLAVVNSEALRLAGIDANSPDPPGGKIDRDPVTGEPTGILRENAMALVERSLPEVTKDDYRRWIIKAMKALASSGLTSVQTDDFGNLKRFKIINEVYQELKKENKLPLRLNLQVRMARRENFDSLVEKTGWKTGYGDDLLTVGPCKILADGSMGGRTAALFETYNDDKGNKGVLLYEKEELREYVRLANEREFQLAIHGIGDRAINIILDLYQEILKEEAKKRNITVKRAGNLLRPRIIHAQLTNFELIKRMKELNVAVDIQPIFLNSDIHVVKERLGKERVDGTYAWKSMLKNGIQMAGGSDGPIETHQPLAGIYAAVTRKDLRGKPEEGWRVNEALRVEEALRLFTMGSAYNSFSELKKGNLAEGKYADLVVLEDDPRKVHPEEIKDIKVIATYVGGKEQFSN